MDASTLARLYYQRITDDDMKREYLLQNVSELSFGGMVRWQLNELLNYISAEKQQTYHQFHRRHPALFRSMFMIDGLRYTFVGRAIYPRGWHFRNMPGVPNEEEDMIYAVLEGIDEGHEILHITMEYLLYG